MYNYVQALRSKDETPGSFPAMTAEAEKAILNKYQDEVIAATEGKHRNVASLTLLTAYCFIL